MRPQGPPRVELRVRARQGVISVDGEVDEGAVEALAADLLAASLDLTGPLTLELGGLELLDGVAVAELCTALRALRARHGRLSLEEAPQMLAHTLYRVGALEDGSLSVRSVRSEEPTTAN